MQIRWYGQSSFLLRGEHSVFIDPFGSMEAAKERGMRFDYPPIEGVEAELLLVTHEHGDHNAVEVVGGSPQTIRSKAGTFESPLGEVVGVASEHDDVAGTKRGANTIFRFALDGLRVAHFGVLMLPVGGFATVGGEPAAAIVRTLRPRLVVPMHYRTEALSFLDPPDEFLEALGARIERLDGSKLEAERYLGTAEDPTVTLLAVHV
jgi:L-ascorbate metabolism protein UlaG (beta-lactamase superfamily)